MERNQVSVLLSQTVAPETLRQAVATWLAVEVDWLETGDDTTAVLAEVHEYGQGFRTGLTLYIDSSMVSATDLTAARFLSHQLHQECLVDAHSVLDTPQPWNWILVRPDGTLQLVDEVPDDNDGVTIDPASARDI